MPVIVFVNHVLQNNLIFELLTSWHSQDTSTGVYNVLNMKSCFKINSYAFATMIFVLGDDDNKHEKFKFTQGCMQQEQWEVKAWLASKKSKDLIWKKPFKSEGKSTPSIGSIGRLWLLFTPCDLLVPKEYN